MHKKFVLLIAFLCVIQMLKAQQASLAAYPRMMGYFSFTIPIATFTKNSTTTNFSGPFTISFPMGLNLLKSDHFGVSFELAPSIRSEKGLTKMNNLLIHPGAMFRYKHGFTVISRLAFETSGRFGFTPILNQVLVRGKDCNLFVSVALPARFGNNAPASLGTGLQVGVSF